MPTAPHRPAFATLIEPERGGIPASFADPIRGKREHLTSLVVPLRGRIEGHKARTDLSETGKLDLIKADVTRVLIDADHTDRATTATLKNLRGSAQSALSSKLYPSSPNIAPLLHSVQSTAVGLAGRDLGEAKFVFDTEGRAQLNTGGSFHKLLQKTLDTVPLAEAGAVVHAISKLDPLAKAAIGGEPVIEGARAILERRAADEDPEVKGLIELRAMGETAERIHAGDRSTLVSYVAESSGLPRETIHALSPKAATPRAAS